MEIRRHLQTFLEKYQTTGWLLLLMGIGMVLQGLLYLATFPYDQSSAATRPQRVQVQTDQQADREDPKGDSSRSEDASAPRNGEDALSSLAPKQPVSTYQKYLNYITLPAAGKVFMFQPWSLLFYPFFLNGFIFFRLLYDGMLLWSFGRIHQQLLGEQRTRRLVILAVPVLGILSVLLGSIALPNVINPLYISGITPIVVMLIVSSITLVPDYSIELLLFGRVKIVWAGLIMSLLTLTFVNLATAMIIVLGALLGFVHVYLLKQGKDLTELVWSYYQDKEPRTRMKVKYGGDKVEKKPARKRAKVETPKPSEVPQEIIDGILDKISEKGYESLTREEKEILFKVSNQKDEKKE